MTAPGSWQVGAPAPIAADRLDEWFDSFASALLAQSRATACSSARIAQVFGLPGEQTG